jgi:hypothetical protein
MVLRRLITYALMAVAIAEVVNATVWFLFVLIALSWAASVGYGITRGLRSASSEARRDNGTRAPTLGRISSWVVVGTVLCLFLLPAILLGILYGPLAAVAIAYLQVFAAAISIRLTEHVSLRPARFRWRPGSGRSPL